MTTAISHRRRVYETIRPLLGAESLPLAELLTVPRRLATDVRSPIDEPCFDNSSMTATPWRQPR